MGNIFEGAKFGDKFVTRDNRVALYYGKGTDDYHLLIPESYGSFVAYHSSGKEIEEEEHGIDIVSRYNEPIDEKKLNELAWYEAFKTLPLHSETESIMIHRDGFVGGYKAGYRKAKEE